MILFVAALFVALTPGIFISLPKGGSKITVAAVHGLIFAFIFHVSKNFEGFQSRGKDGAPDKWGCPGLSVGPSGQVFGYCPVKKKCINWTTERCPTKTCPKGTAWCFSSGKCLTKKILCRPPETVGVKLDKKGCNIRAQMSWSEELNRCATMEEISELEGGNDMEM